MAITVTAATLQTGLSVGAGASGVDSNTLDVSTKYQTKIFVHGVYSAVDSTTGLVVDLHENNQQTTPKWTTEPVRTKMLPGSTTQKTLVFGDLPPGKYKLTFKNNDATNGATVDITYVTVDTV